MVDSKENYKFDLGVIGLTAKSLSFCCYTFPYEFGVTGRPGKKVPPDKFDFCHYLFGRCYRENLHNDHFWELRA